MPNASDSGAVIRENLLDAGFDADSADKMMALISGGNRPALDNALRSHRKDLLDKVHLYTRQLDCLDYFTYTLNHGGN